MESTKQILLDEAYKVYNNACKQQISEIRYSNNECIDAQLHDLKNYPYLFVLACVMDRQIKAEQAWSIPYKVCESLGVNNFEELSNSTEEQIINCFNKEKLHRFNNDMAINFYKAIKRIKDVYNGDASRIWNDNPSSAEVVYRFLCFEGVGIKIATMATNILARDFKIKFKDMKAIDVSPDVHVRRILNRLGLIEREGNDAAIYKAKEINPDFPGIIDLMCWKYGREYCHPTKPDCINCPLRNTCNYNKSVCTENKYKSK